MDSDKDGIACEVLKKLPAKNPVQAPAAPVDPESGWVETTNFSEPQRCQILDAREPKRQPNNVGFPLREDLVPSKGVANLIVIPVDFSDKPAGALPSDYLRQQMEEMNRWYQHFSGGKLSLRYQIADKWVRAPKPDSAYVVPKNQANTPGAAQAVQFELAQDAINAAGTSLDFSDAHGVFLYMPTVQSVDYDMGLRGSSLRTPAGQKSLFLWGGGAYHFDDRNVSSTSKREKMWAFWIHEMLHSQDQALHAPGNGFSSGLGQNQYGTSLTLSTWELFRFGWIDARVKCLDSATLTSASAVLRPLELGADSMSAVILRVNQYEVLVIESRRSIGYSKEWDGRGGALIYRVDTRLDNDRSGEASGDTGNSVEFSKWGFYIAPLGRDISGERAKNIHNYLFGAGDSVTTSGVKVSVKSSSPTGDWISIERAG